MKKFNIVIAANIRAYASIDINAENEDAAWQRAKDIAAAGNPWALVEMDNVVFNPEYDTLSEFEALEDTLEEDKDENEEEYEGHQSDCTAIRHLGEPCDCEGYGEYIAARDNL